MHGKNTSKDHVAFIDIIFAMIIGMSFGFFKDYLVNFSLTLINMMVFGLFVATYFFIISDWIFYHELMNKYPYTKDYSRFFIDLVVFFLMFLLTYFAFNARNTKYLIFYIVNVALWHFGVATWHYYAKKEYQYMKKEIDKSIVAHIKRFVYFASVAILYFIADQFIVNENVTYFAAAFITVGLIGYFNWNRLKLFNHSKDTWPEIIED